MHAYGKYAFIFTSLHESPARYIIPCICHSPVCFSFQEEGKKYGGSFAGDLPQHTTQ
jgi:hypothetical protein